MSGTSITSLNIDLKLPPIPEGLERDGNGVWTFIYREDMKVVEDFYGRKGLCLKVLRNPFRGDLGMHYWGYHNIQGQPDPNKASPVIEAMKIQNIYAMEGLAPRVYDLILLNGEYIAMVTDDLGERDDRLVNLDSWFAKLREVGEKYQIETFEDGRITNVVAGKWVDFQGFRFKDNYEEELSKRIVGTAKWGPFPNYQPVPELDLKGGRDTNHRIDKLQLKTIDFRNKVVLDIGCSDGVFCHYAWERGAKRVIGLEMPEIAKVAFELANFLGYHNMDFYGVDLKNATYQQIVDIVGIENFDVVLFLSMSRHVGYPGYLDKLVKDTLVWEGNSWANDMEAKQNIVESYNILTESVTEDLFLRPVIIGRKK